MTDTESFAEKEQSTLIDAFYLPEFFQNEFPNLTKFLNENLLKEYHKQKNITNLRK